MNIFSRTGKIIITCHKWLAPALSGEVEALGYTPTRVFQTGVELEGTGSDCIRLNLNLRCASQVLYAVKSFTCDSPDDLYRAVKLIAWENIFDAEGYFSVTGNVTHETITNSMFANLRVKDAVVDRLREKKNVRPNTGAELKGAVVSYFWRGETAEIFLDTTGDSLARHGYRKLPGRAPMLEALAAATILSSKWDKQSPFVNPMCGSGTLAIEAALIAANQSPALLRSNYAFMHLKGYEAAFYEAAREKLYEQIGEGRGLKIIATDISAQAIKTARLNAEAAGVDELIDFQVCDFADTEVPQGEGGVVFFNPEYGDRLGAEQELEETYARMGDFMKQRCKGYTGYIFTGNLELAKRVGLKAARRVEFYNATIDCRLFEYELYAGSRRPPLEA